MFSTLFLKEFHQLTFLLLFLSSGITIHGYYTTKFYYQRLYFACNRGHRAPPVCSKKGFGSSLGGFFDRTAFLLRNLNYFATRKKRRKRRKRRKWKQSWTICDRSSFFFSAKTDFCREEIQKTGQSFLAADVLHVSHQLLNVQTKLKLLSLRIENFPKSLASLWRPCEASARRILMNNC